MKTLFFEHFLNVFLLYFFEKIKTLKWSTHTEKSVVICENIQL